MKYIVVSQDREVYRIFKAALGIEPMKISSVLAVITVLADKDSAFSFVIIDKELKDVDKLLKLLKKRKITFYIIGEDFEKPISIEQINMVISLTSSTHPLVRDDNISSEPKSIFIESDYDGIPPRDGEEDKIFINLKDKKPQELIEENGINLNASEVNKVNDTLAEVDKEESLIDTKKGFNFAKILSTSKKSVAKAKEIRDGLMAIPGLSKGKTKIISQKVIGIRRVKGGVGSTSIALHLAQGLARERIKSCVIDLNFVDGGSDLSYYLNLPKIPHWGNFLRNSEKRDSFQEALLEYNGFSILQVPPAMSLIEDYLTQESIIKAMNNARKEFSMVIIDLPNEITPLIREVLDYFLTTTVLVSAGHLAELNRIEKLNDLDNPIIVMNGPGGKNLDKFKAYLNGIDNFISIPEDGELYRNLEKNNLRNPNTPYGKGINNLIDKILAL